MKWFPFPSTLQGAYSRGDGTITLSSGKSLKFIGSNYYSYEFPETGVPTFKGYIGGLILDGVVDDSAIYLKDNGANRWIIQRDDSQSNSLRVYSYSATKNAIAFRLTDAKVISFVAFSTGSPISFEDGLSLTPGSAPATPTEGMIYANSTDHHLYFYNGTAWVQLD